MTSDKNETKEDLNKKLDYDIIRETKTIIFDDISEIEDETTYLIKFKEEINEDKNYFLETPLPYFRIPEKYCLDGTVDKLYSIEFEKLINKIIWFIIFEEIYYEKTNIWTNYREELKQKLQRNDINNNNYKTDYKNSNISENFNSFLDKKFKVINFLEENDNFKKVLDYPDFNIEKKKKLHHNIDFKLVTFTLFTFYLYVFLFSIYIHPSLIFRFIFNFISLSLLILIYMKIKKKASSQIMKTGDLEQKFVNSITTFLLSNTESLDVGIIKNKNQGIKLYLDLHSDEIYFQLYNFIYNDLERYIKNFKSFNPISLEILLNDKKVLPLPTDYENFFHYTTIQLNFKNIDITHYNSLTIKTKSTVLDNLKEIRILEEIDKLIPIKIISSIVFSFLMLSIILFFTRILNFTLLLLFYLVMIIILFLIYAIRKINYIYFSPLQEIIKDNNLPQIQNNQSNNNYNLKLERNYFISNYIKFYFNKNQKFFTLPINLRKNCSYYWLIYAPRFHTIKIVEEMKDLMKKLYPKLPHGLSEDKISFNIPRQRIYNEGEFYIDLQIKKTFRIVLWYCITIVMMSVIMIFFIVFILLKIISNSTINITIFSLNITIFSLILSSLALLWGLFGRDFLSNLTNDLKSWSYILMLLIFLNVIFFIIYIII